MIPERQMTDSGVELHDYGNGIVNVWASTFGGANSYGTCFWRGLCLELGSKPGRMVQMMVWMGDQREIQNIRI